MSMTVNAAVNEVLGQFEGRDPDLVRGVREQLDRDSLEPLVEAAAEKLSLDTEVRDRAIRSVAAVEAPPVPDTEARLIAETIVRPMLRPVLRIRDNTLVMEFFGADVAVWRDRLAGARTILDAVIPSVGRVEVTNHPGYTWVGTGWLIAEDVVVTNRHVAREFARRDNQRFVFRTGINGGPMTCRIDFLEEFDRTHALEFAATEVLWIAPSTDADIAFLRVARNSGGSTLARPVPLSAASHQQDQFVATIGYPARDDEFPDQDLARRVFGDVYDKKRLAPGQVLESPADEVLHDCSTLGGNSGSVVVDLTTGEAVALHYAGLFPTANFAVPAPIVRDRLRRVQRGEFAPVLSGGSAVARKPVEPKERPTPPAAQPQQTAAASTTFIIPLEITIGVGTPTVRVGGTTVDAGTGSQPTPPAPPSGPVDTSAAVEAARRALSGHSDVHEVRLGYRFQSNWITDEPAIVIELKPGVTAETLRASIPEQFGGVGVEIRSATLLEHLRAEGVAVPAIEEAVARGNYRKPTHLRLREVRDEPMVAIFHASPDSGFPNLRAFLARTDQRITGTMYEFDSDHVLAALSDAVRPAGRRLTMVTQKQGTEGAVEELVARLGNRFDHVWASVGAARLFPMAYHIKVAVRDGEEFWLSSGNFKNSGQPNIDPAGSNSTSWAPLRNNNREWHAIIQNANLAAQFEQYIQYDFSEAERVPLPEAPALELPDVFVPDVAAFERLPEAPARYFDPLVVNRPLHIQPLLSPDNYIEHVTALIEEAERSIYIHNQSFNLLGFDEDGGRGNNEQAFFDLFALLRDRQETHDVKIIFRHAREFGQASWESQKRLLERLQAFGFDLENNVKLQYGCHTKGVIVDSERVLLGSHNLTNQGALYNRDASLIVYDAEVARYYQSIFLFDWENRAVRESVEELPRAVRVAQGGEETPAGMRRVSMAELLHTFIE